MKRFFVFLLVANSAIFFASNVETEGLKFIQFFSAGNFEGAQSMSSQLLLGALSQSGLTLQSFWAKLTEQVGVLKQIKRVKSGTEQGYQIAYVGCEFEKATLDAKIVFDKEMKVAGLQFLPYVDELSFRVPEYAKTENFVEIECSVGKGEWQLPGTLTMPKGEGPFPVVVLVHGSGPNDRDETVGANKPFRDLAWGLASNGIAVLRYDKRTKVYAQEYVKRIDAMTIKEEVIDDALAAIDLAKTFEKIDHRRIFLLGHSLGGTIAPRIAAQTDELAGVILLAPASRGLYIVNALKQYEYIFSLDGKIDEQESKQIQELREQIERIQNRQLKESEVLLGASKAYWEDLLEYDPLETAKTLKTPILLLQGARDYQVTIEDYQMWQEALKEKKDVTLILYPDLNHLFITGSGLSTPYEYQQPGNVSEQVIKDISEWIKRIQK
ncbi:MAG: alpha/beta fold hydrolase [Pseudothermotoga sp.]